MPCNSESNEINITPAPPWDVPGFGLSYSPVQIPLPSFDLPTELLEDIIGLVQKITALWPGGLLKVDPQFSMKTVLDFIASLLSKISPFLSFYNFIMALLRMVICVLEVLCAIPNPFAVAAKLKQLFTDCLPPFINLFPFLALIAMIIALLLLILALIEFIINTIINIIEQIIKNLEILANGLQLQDANATLAAINKIASLLCFIQNLMAIFIALAAILAIIETLAKLAGFGICSDEDPDGCCPPALCPGFIKNTPDGIPVVGTGVMKYISQIGVDLTSGLPPSLAAVIQVPPLREERWQIYDLAQDATYQIKDIITPSLFGTIYWPDEVLEFPADSQAKRALYTVDVNVTANPNDFGHTDFAGEREFVIKDCIVVRKPYVGTYEYNNALFPVPNTGTLNIEGGLVYEKDGTTPFLISGTQATLNTFIHIADLPGVVTPPSDDSVTFNNVSFTWKPNAAALAGYQLTTVGCMPEVNIEKAIQNSILVAEGLSPVIDKLPPTPAGKKVPSTGTFLPNVNGAVDCVNQALTEFRQNITFETAANFQAAIQVCLGDLKDQTSATLCATLLAGVSQFKSNIEVDNNLQFTSRPIIATVTLKDAIGTNLGTGIPQECGDQMAELLIGTVTFGEITDFSYKSASSNFQAEITAVKSGSGELTVTYDGKILNSIVSGVVGGISSSISPIEIAYQFVDATTEPPVRRDEGDII